MLGNFLRNQDIYGSPFKVHYKGNGAYTTVLGGVLTLITFILICINTLEIAIQFFNGTAQKESVNTV